MAIIDGAVEEPVIESFNDLQALAGFSASYHLPAFAGTSSFHRIRDAEAIMFLGSASSVHDGLAWHQDLRELLKSAIKRKQAVLGICFGHQFIAHYFGAKVGFIHEDQKKEKGYRELEFQSDFFTIKKSEKLKISVTHNEEVKNLPKGFEVLATSVGFELDGIRHQELPIWSFQPHPESSCYFLQKNAEVSDRGKIQMLKSDGDRLLQAFLSQLKKAR